jgi:hypothetical protein
MKRVLWFAGAMLFFVVVLLAVHFSTTNEEFSRYNLQWNGTSRFFDLAGDAGAGEIGDLASLSGTNATFLFIIAPAKNFTAGDAMAYRLYLVQGNTIFLADDFGTGNELLSGLGSRIRILPGNLTSVSREFDDPSSVIVTPVRGNETFPGNVTTLVLNRPAALEGGESLATSSLLSWIDRDGDGLPGQEEVFGRYDVFSRERIGKGTLYVLSDPSVFINDMSGTDTGDNRVFIGQLVADAGVIAIDQTHGRTATDDPLIRTWNTLQESVPARLLIVSILIVIVAYLFRRGNKQ